MNKYQQIDLWWCDKCRINYLTPSVPHTPECPKCGTGGWWRKFATADEVQAMHKKAMARLENESDL